MIVRHRNDGQPVMSDYKTVAKVGEIPEGHGKAFAVGDRLIAVFCDHGQYFAIDDCCPHQGTSLATGRLADGVVTCPDHAWRFSIRDGSWCDFRRNKLDCFEVRVVGDEIQVRVPDAD
jgi:nitrite reductase (NADH) small subunit